MLVSGESISREEIEALDNAAKSVRLTARIVDAPCSVMHTDAFLKEVVVVGKGGNIAYLWALESLFG